MPSQPDQDKRSLGSKGPGLRDSATATVHVPGPFTLADVLERNSKWIIPAAWRDLGEKECLRRVREMRLANLKLREEISGRFNTDQEFREAEMKACAEDLVYWCTRWAWLYNADARQSIPFLPIEFQITEALYPFYIDQYTPLDEDNPEADRRNHMVEKPRKVGFTYCILFGGSWAMCFHHMWPIRDKGAPHVGGVAADVKDNVKDRENPESHMGRLEQILRALPTKMLPGPIREDKELDEDGNPVRKRGGKKGNTFGETKISFPENKSFIRAAAASRNAGRAGRFSWFLFDEEEFAEKARAMVRGLMDATACLWRITSVNGKGNSFHRDWSNPRLKVTRHDIHYWMVPWYGERWLKSIQEGRSDDDFQREILKNRDTRSGAAYWSPPWSEPVNVVDTEIKVCATTPLYIGLDIGKADGASLIYAQKDPETETVLGHGMVFRRGAVLEWLVPFLLGKFPERNETGDKAPGPEYWHPLDRQFVERVGEMIKVAPSVRIVAGSDAKQSSMHYDSLIVQMWRMWKIRIVPVRIDDKREAIDAVKWMVPYLRINRKVNQMTPGQYDDEGAPFTMSDVFYQYRKKTDRQTEEILPSGTPVHDHFSNPADSWQYLVKEMPRVMRRTPQEIARVQRAREMNEANGRRANSVKGLFQNVFGTMSTAGRKESVRV